jgi:D-amino-acid oxidase
MEDFRLAGGRVRVRAFATLAEVAALEESIIANCTGLGARELSVTAISWPSRDS